MVDDTSQSIVVNTSPWLKIEKVHDKEKVLIDEKIARQQAKILGLEVIGTLGLLLKAKNKGLLSSIKPLINKILENGIWINDEIVKGILKAAGE